MEETTQATHSQIDPVQTFEAIELLSTDEEMESELTLFPHNDDLAYPQEHLKLELDYMDEKQQEDKLWKARTGLNDDTICGAIETILFMSDKPISLMKVKALIDEDMPLRVIHESITRLQKEYELKHHGIRLQEVANGYQFRTKATYAKYVQDIFKVSELVLSPTALEVLAIIAYKQPVSKVEVEKIRGVDSSHIVRALMDKRLVKVTGRSEEVGKPVLYGTTEEFLEVFNLANLDQMPPEHELKEMATASVGKITDIKTLVNADLESLFNNEELNELDLLSDSIKSIESDTEFIKSIKTEEKKRFSGENHTIKTAFDLLEEYLDKTIVSNANKVSVESELFSGVLDPKVIRDLLSGPFNIPEEIEEDEEFQMIDLDTGEVIVNDYDNDDEIELQMEDDLDVSFELSDLDETNNEIISLDADEDEATQLAKALDDAFSKLMGGNSLLNSDFNEEEISDELDSKTDRMIDEARDLDIDLSFLKNNNLEDFEDLN